MDIGTWLVGLGLERYTQAFLDNDIAPSVLPELTDEDLKELGVSLGHRRLLLKAIKALSEDQAEPSPARGLSHPSSASVSAPRPEAERRQLTVLFCDLVGSTELSAQLDPEELREVIGAYQASVAELVRRWEGHVAKYMGDGVLAYFGWPQAHEDDPERAVRAGLDLVEAVGRLRAGIDAHLAARVGIATGQVVVGDLVGAGGADKDSVVGGTPNLAARLQQLAEPGTAVVAEGTWRLLGGLFEAEHLGEQPVRGFAAPVRVWRVLGERRVEGRFEARQAAGGLTPLVGRERELGLLLGRWGLAAGGEGQVVLLAGEPGVGKSRLVEALRERLGDAPHLLLRYQCSPQHTGSALHPVIARLEPAAGFRREDGAETRLAKLEALLRRELGDDDVPAAAPLFAALLEIPADGRYPPLALTPPQRKAKTLEVLARQLEALAGRRPVLLVFEDLHWADPTSLELLGTIVDRIERRPMLAVLTFRPETTPVPAWSGRAHVTLLDLDRLSRPDAAALAERVAGGTTLPAEVLDQILARTDGVPLFVEELTRAVLEAGRPAPQAVIPSTLHDSLMARLDRLGSVKEVAQLAACLGREFSHEMLAAVSPLGADALGTALERLAASGLIHRQGRAPAALYAFRHALVQEAAYQSLLRARRRELHTRIARAVEDRFPEIAARQPEWVAHHCTEAGLTGPASAYWLEAARRAKAAYALREAAAHLERCLDMLRLADGPQVAKLGARRIEALVLLGDVASLAGDLEGSNWHYERALDLAGDDPEARTRIGNRRHRPRVTFRGGARIAFYEHGGGPDTLLLVSPLAYGLATIQPLLERLCQEFRVVTVDPRGSGASDLLTRPFPLDEHLRDVRTVIAALGDRPVIGVGLSNSGNLLLKLAHAEPRLFAKLVTVGTPPGDFSRPSYPSDYMEEREAALESQDVTRLVRSHTERVLSEPEMRELREQTIRNRLLLPRETILSFFDPDPGKDVMPLLAEIPTPVLVTHGRKDRLVSFVAAERIAAGLPNARLYAFEGKGHLPIFTATDEFCEVLRRFVRTGEARP